MLGGPFRRGSNVHARNFLPQFTGPSLMRPIELTRIINGKGVEVQVNPDLIACFTATDKEYESTVSFESGWTITVAETPKQIIGRLADHRSAMHAEEHDGIEIFR